MKYKWFLFGLLILSLALVACGGGDSNSGSTADAGGNAANGETLYKQTVIGSASAPGCVTCHSLEPGTVLVGPSHATIGAQAGSRVPGLTAEEYLRQSIKEPDAHVEDGFTAGVMYQNYATDLTDQQIDDLVAFLLTQK